jgi:hypothetical protein
MTGQEVRTAVLDGLALVEAELGKDRRHPCHPAARLTALARLRRAGGTSG